MVHTSLSALSEIAIAEADGVVRLPTLVKGELVYPRAVAAAELVAAAQRAPGPAAAPSSFRLEDLQVIREPVLDPQSLAFDGQWRFLVLARPDPRRLVEDDPAELARSLYALPFADVLDYVAELRDLLRANRDAVVAAGGRIQGGPLDPRLLALVFDMLPGILDPALLAEAVDRELGADGVPGRRYLDGWVEVDTRAPRGMTARIAAEVFETPARAPAFRPSLRAVPTRQLHITAGNSPLVPLVSLLRGLATKGACVVKSPAEACAASAILAAAMHAVDDRHPITRHTSLVYWPGGDQAIEDALFAPGAFDRVVVWGSAETVRSVQLRSQAKTLTFNPRYGLSLIGREAFAGRLGEVAARATIDTLIWEQRACTASLVHYVEGDEEAVLEYCRALQAALARWDRALPRPVPRATLGRLRLLRRGELMRATWFENGVPPEVTSAVAYAPGPFDLALHPMSRLVVVRRLERLEDVVPFLSSAASSVGVFPEVAIPRLRDVLTAAGVSNVFPLGECERGYPGIPHDGMRVLSELVNWVSSATSGEIEAGRQ